MPHSCYDSSRRSCPGLLRLPFRFLCVLLLLALCGCGDEEVVVVGVLDHLGLYPEILEGFREGLADKGYVEGENLQIVFPGTPGDPRDLDFRARQLVDSDVDLILALTEPAAQAARNATQGTAIPVVFIQAADAVRCGLVQNHVRPGGNLTGISNEIPNHLLELRRLDWLLKMAGNPSHVYILFDEKPESVETMRLLTEKARSRGVTLIPGTAGTVKEAREAVLAIPEKAQAVFISLSPLFYHNSVMPLAIETARRKSLPLISATTDSVKLGGFLCYGIDPVALGRQASMLAARILGGADAAAIPLQSPMFYLAVNLKTAQDINISLEEENLRLMDFIVR